MAALAFIICFRGRSAFCSCALCRRPCLRTRCCCSHWHCSRSRAPCSSRCLRIASFRPRVQRWRICSGVARLSHVSRDSTSLHPTSTDLLHLRRCRQTAATALATVAVVAVRTVAAAATVSAALNTAMSTAHRCRADSAATAQPNPSTPSPALPSSPHPSPPPSPPPLPPRSPPPSPPPSRCRGSARHAPHWRTSKFCSTRSSLAAWWAASAAGAAVAASSARLLAGRAAIRAAGAAAHLRRALATLGRHQRRGPCNVGPGGGVGAPTPPPTQARTSDDAVGP